MCRPKRQAAQKATEKLAAGDKEADEALGASLQEQSEQGDLTQSEDEDEDEDEMDTEQGENGDDAYHVDESDSDYEESEDDAGLRGRPGQLPSTRCRRRRAPVRGRRQRSAHRRGKEALRGHGSGISYRVREAAPRAGVGRFIHGEAPHPGRRRTDRGLSEGVRSRAASGAFPHQRPTRLRRRTGSSSSNSRR